MKIRKINGPKFRFFSKTIKALIKLVTKKNLSNLELSENFLLFIEEFFEIIVSRSVEFMVRGKRNILTFDDLKNSLYDFININSFSTKKLIYRKPIKNLNLLTKKQEKKFYQKQMEKTTTFYFLEDWMNVSVEKFSNNDEMFENQKKKKTKKKKIPKKFSKYDFSSLSLSLLTSKTQFFYQYLIAVLKKGTREEEEACLESLTKDQSLFAVVPYVIVYLNQFLLKEIKFSSKFEFGIKIIRALFLNNSFKLEPFIHQILPILIKILIGDFGKNSSSKVLDLRLYSANIIGFIVNRFGQRYIGLQSRLSFYFSKRFFHINENFSVIHGALIGLVVLGNKTLELSGLPFFPIIIEKIEFEIRKENIEYNVLLNIKKLNDYIVNILIGYLINKRLHVFWHDQGKICDGKKLEIVYKLYPKIKETKQLIDNIKKKKSSVQK